MFENRVILHSDLNKFYASVECFYDPSIRNKPVVVTGDPEKRHGIILTKNEIAAARGIKTGEAIWEAKCKCPDLVCVKPNYERYKAYSKATREIYSKYTDRIENFGIDEAWLDVTASTGIFGDGEKIADEIREQVKRELGVTVSIGVSWNKPFAKLGSDIAPKDATNVITRHNYQEKIFSLPVNELMYVGRKTKKKFFRWNIKTIGDLAQYEVRQIKRKLGKNGEVLWIFANGLDQTNVSHMNSSPLIKSIGNSTTAPRDLIDDADVHLTVAILAESVAHRLRVHDFKTRCVQIYVRDKNLMSFTRQVTLERPTYISTEIIEAAMNLYKADRPFAPVRSIGVRGQSLIRATPEQTSFAPYIQDIQKRERLESTIDTIRGRFGQQSVHRGIVLTDDLLGALNPIQDNTVHPESYFRERID